MALRELFKGIAVVIDDEIDNPKASISKIIEQIENEKIPIIKYNEIPEDGVLANFDSISFLLLDWEIQERDFLSENHTGVPVYKSSTLDDENVNKVVALIDSFKELCFCPIFIFTNLDVDSIKEELKAKMSVDKVPEYIFVKSKSELTGDGNLFTEIERWISGNPSVYVLKEWDKKHKKSKNKLFFDYQEMSPFWPCIMWKNFEEDGANKSMELCELISRNINNRMKPFDFENDILNKDIDTILKSELRTVLEGERFLKKIDPSHIGTGDVFKETVRTGADEKALYYINIKAQCDLQRDTDPSLYLIVGQELIQKANGKIDNIHFSKGEFIEKSNHSVVAFIDGGKIVEFSFNMDLTIKKWSEYKEKRIGRLLPPYITRIQQRYALYLQRQGLPSIPNKAVI